MNTKYWLVSAFLAFSLSALAQSGVSVKTVSKAGILHNQFQGESLERIKVLKLKGVLNKQDIKFINNELHVSELDLSEATFDNSIAKEGHFPGYLFEKLQGCLQRLVLPSNIQYLDDNAFTSMFKLESVSFCNTIYTVGKSAFKGCGRLVINGDEFNKATLIDDYAFYNCASIQAVQLSDKINKLGLKVFWGCKSLQRVEFDPNNEELLFIPEGAFFGCESLQQVDIPTLVKSIDKSAFVGCHSLNTIRMRTIIPPMLADKAFDDRVHAMSLIVRERSLKLYSRSSNWRKFRDFLVSDTSHKLYEKGQEEARIKPMVVLVDSTEQKPDMATAENKPDSTFMLIQEDFKEVKGKQKETPAERKQETKPTGNKDKNKEKNKDEQSKQTTPAVVTAEGRRTPVLSVPKKKEEKKEDNEDAFAKLVRDNTRVVVTKPTTYFDSPIINQAVSALTLYQKDGMIHIEAPAKIKQLTIIDRTGRTIYANRLSETLYSTSVEQSSIKLLRAVYENGIETKRY